MVFIFLLQAIITVVNSLLILIAPRVLCGNRVAYTALACDVFVGVNEDVWTELPS